LVEAARVFAEQELGLQSGGSFTSFVDAGREHLVWNVFAAPADSVDLVNWCFPVAGCVSYRGYFSEQAAQRYADKLTQQGLDVYVGGVDAYSTLGWFEDPLPSTVLRRSDTQLAGLIFHELAHQRVYLPGDTRFNESFASFVEREGLRRWLEHTGQVELYQRAMASLEVQQRFAQFVGDYREQLRVLYAESAPASVQQASKNIIINEMRSAWTRHQDAAYYTEWFAGDINNAKLATVAAYFDWVPAFEQLFLNSGQQFEVFLTQVEAMTHVSNGDRQQQLNALQSVRLQDSDQAVIRTNF
jgi:predicted aminopeptidase